MESRAATSILETFSKTNSTSLSGKSSLSSRSIRTASYTRPLWSPWRFLRNARTEERSTHGKPAHNCIWLNFPISFKYSSNFSLDKVLTSSWRTTHGHLLLVTRFPGLCISHAIPPTSSIPAKSKHLKLPPMPLKRETTTVGTRVGKFFSPLLLRNDDPPSESSLATATAPPEFDASLQVISLSTRAPMKVWQSMQPMTHPTSSSLTRFSARTPEIFPLINSHTFSKWAMAGLLNCSTKIHLPITTWVNFRERRGLPTSHSVVLITFISLLVLAPSHCPLPPMNAPSSVASTESRSDFSFALTMPAASHHFSTLCCHSPAWGVPSRAFSPLA